VAARDRRIVVVSDMQIPHHDRRSVDALITFVADYTPDLVYVIGDEWDATSVSRWARGTSLETSPGALQKELDATSAVMARLVTAAGNAPVMVHRSNHTDRMNHYLMNAPALRSLNCLTLESLLGYDTLGVKVNREPYPIAPGWVACHGDESGTNQTAGGTALGLAKKMGLSCVAGHTHRQGLQHWNAGHGGKVTHRITGFEVGHLMNYPTRGKQPGPSYLKFGGANWQQGFGLLTVHKGHTYPTPVPIINNRFIVDGKAYQC